MPVEWITRPKETPDQTGVFLHQHPEGEELLVELHLWPHRSLSKRGFALVIGGAFALLLVPMLSAIGTPVLWGVLPFALAVLALLYFALQRSYRDGEVLEVLRLRIDKVTLTQHASHRPMETWSAHPYWVEVRLHRTGGPVSNYVTLRGGGREVEIGAFLSEDERLDLFAKLSRYLPLRG